MPKIGTILRICIDLVNLRGELIHEAENQVILKLNIFFIYSPSCWSKPVQVFYLTQNIFWEIVINQTVDNSDFHNLFFPPLLSQMS